MGWRVVGGENLGTAQVPSALNRKGAALRGLAAVLSLAMVILPLVGLLVTAVPPISPAAAASTYSPKVLIISNDDAYYSSSVSGGTSAAAMQTTLANNGYQVTVWSETSQGVPTVASSNANSYDVVIFTEGVGYRNTSNGKPGLDSGDLSFLKEYLNLGGVTGNKARLLLEGEDIWWDISKVGTASDQPEVLKIDTTSSAQDAGTITSVSAVTTPTVHPVVQGLSSPNSSTYQTNWQDGLVAGNNARIVLTSNLTPSGAINVWDDGQAHREIFMPFAWYASASNTISSSQAWRDQLLLNAVRWVGERKLSVTGVNLAGPTVYPASTGNLMEKWTFSVDISTAYLTSLTLDEPGTATAASAVTAVKIYNDANNNGIAEAGELIGTSPSTFSAGSETTTFSLGATPLSVAAGSPVNLLITYDISASAALNSTVGVRLAAANSVGVPADDLLTTVNGSFPIDSALSTITSTGTAQITSPANNATVNGKVSGGFPAITVTGTASSDYTLKYGPKGTTDWNAGPGVGTIATGGAITNGTLGTWDTSARNDGWYTLHLSITTGAVGEVDVYVDHTPPAITGPSVTNLTNTAATITWTTDDPSTSVVEYRLSGSTGPYTVVSSDALVTSHAVSLSGLTSNTSYDYHVKSVDAAGNSTITSPDASFTTLSDGAFASIVSPASNSTITGVVSITGTAKTFNVSGSVYWSVYYGAGYSSVSVADWTPLLENQTTQVDNGVLMSSWNTAGLNGPYGLKLEVQDTTLTGPTSTSTAYSFFNIDNSPPVIADVTATDVTNTTATIKWITDEQTSGVVKYGTAPGTYTNTVTETGNSRSVFLSGLTRATIYYYVIQVTDTVGLTTTSVEFSFTTTDNPDTTPPTPPSSLQVTPRSDTAVDLNWTAGSDNTGISAYKVYRAQSTTAPPDPSYAAVAAVSAGTLNLTDSGLVAATTYWYKVTAVDLAGNESPLSASPAASATTLTSGRLNPHGTYAELTDVCAKCHATHVGLKANLFRDTLEERVCFTCHDGSGSQYNVSAEYAPSKVSRHPLPMAHTRKECASCHNPHLSASKTPRLLAAKNTITGAVNSSGNAVCLTCHGNDLVSKVANDIGGSHQFFDQSIHNTSSLVPYPPSGTQIKCRNCHWNHGSDYVRLTVAKEENVCYQCHDKSSFSKSGIVIKDKFDPAKNPYHHRISDTDQANGAKVECVNCHNTHFIQKPGDTTVTPTPPALADLSDPSNTISNWSTTGLTLSEFCLRCHGPTPPTKSVTSSSLVPYTVTFPNNPPTNFTTNSGGWNKSAYFNSGHFKQGFQCSQCHDPHGSTNPWLTLAAEENNCLSCHASGGPAAAKDIQSLLAKTYKHPVSSSGSHSNTENYGSLGTRHSECTDCHNPHAADATSPAKRQQVAGSQKDVSGVSTTYGTAGGAAPAFTFTTQANYQNETCLKCHSSYAYGALPPNDSSGTAETDQSAEFNPNNASLHPVTGPGRLIAENLTVSAGKVTVTNKPIVDWNQDGVVNPTDVTVSAGTVTAVNETTGEITLSGVADGTAVTVTYGFYNPYTVARDSNGDGIPDKVTMNAPFNQNLGERHVLKCTDCHGVDTTATTYDADTSTKGPHGSANQYLLKKPWNSNDLCLLCHKKAVYWSKTNQSWSRYPSHPHYANYCRDCHGGNRKGFFHGRNIKYNETGKTVPSSIANNYVTKFLAGNRLTGWLDTGSRVNCYRDGGTSTHGSYTPNQP